MPCILNKKLSDRRCEFCLEVCDERPPKPYKIQTTSTIKLNDNMNYKEKYEAALERAKYYQKENGSAVISAIFPELVESEDEQVRKALIEYFSEQCDMSDWNGVYGYQVVAWLEKQGEQKSVEDSLTLEEFENAFITKAEQYDIDLPNRSWDIYALCKELYSLKHKPKQGEKNPAEWHIEDEQNLNACLGYIPDELLRRWLKDVIHAKYDKPINKLEAKFHEGDWVVTDKGDTVQIETVNNDYYTIGNGMLFSMPYVDTCWHSWTIQDAKDGDVLVDVYENTGIFQKNDDFDWTSYCSLGCNGGFQNFEVEHESENAHPATKEQRDFLFQKMQEAGYEWNVDKKELKKIPYFRRDLMQADSIMVESSWNEEDEKILNGLISSLARIGASTRTDSTNINYTFSKEIDWLKSLRPMWKPSDEQMEVLKDLVDDNDQRYFYSTLKSLYNDLEKLKENKL